MQLHERLMSEHPHLRFVFDPMMPLSKKGFVHEDTIYLNPIQDENYLGTVIAEEISHHLTGAGDITKQGSLEEEKQEQRARDMGATLIVTPKELLSCFKAGLVTYWECAEFLEIPIETLQRAVNVYARSNNGKLKYNHYTFYFRANGTIDIVDWLN